MNLIKKALRTVKLQSSYVLCSIQYSKSDWDDKQIILCPDHYEVINQWTNLMVKLWLPDGECYFRFCQEHTDIVSYVRTFYDLFCYKCNEPRWQEKLCSAMEIEITQFDQIVKKFLVAIDNWMVTNGNIKKILIALPRNISKSGISLWGERAIPLEVILKLGFPELSHPLCKLLPPFVDFLVTVLTCYRRHILLTKGMIEASNYSKFKTAYEFFAFMQSSNEITKPEAANIKIGNSIYRGFVCKSVGFPATKQSVELTPSLQRELAILNVLDVIIGERDHGPNNYALQMDEHGSQSLCCFDNDGDDAFNISPRINFQGAFTSASIVKNNQINRVYMDRDLLYQMKRTHLKDLIISLSPYISRIQIMCMYIRMKRLLKAAYRSINLIYLAPSEWSELTLERELFDKMINRKNYLLVYNEKCGHI